ncbi:4138_t:CDS:2, partial [Entrophospora sp. SA101]
KNNVKRHHKYSEWCITGFLNECEEEPFEIKIDLYIKSLEDIVKHEKGNRAEKAQTLIDRYKKERDAMMNNSGAINGVLDKRNQEVEDHKVQSKKPEMEGVFQIIINFMTKHQFRISKLERIKRRLFKIIMLLTISFLTIIFLKKNEQPENPYYKEPKCRSTTSQLDNDSDDHEKYQDYEENVSSETVASWVLSNGKDVGKVLSKYHLSGEDIEVKNLFTDEEWNEMTQDFKSNVNLNGLEDEQERPIYELMDKITKKPSDLIARIESCVIKLMQLDDLFRHIIRFNNFKLNSAYNLQRLHLPMSEASFGSNFTNTITRGILTFDQIYHYEEGEIQGLASSVITIMKTKPTDRSLIGQKMYFRISKDQFEMLIGLRPGGLPSAPKSKKWMVKVDLAVVLQDVLINKGIKTMA